MVFVTFQVSDPYSKTPFCLFLISWFWFGSWYLMVSRCSVGLQNKLARAFVIIDVYDRVSIGCDLTANVYKIVVFFFFFFVHLGISGIQQVKWVPLGFIVVLLSNGDHYFTLGHQRGSVEYHCGLVGYSKAPWDIILWFISVTSG